ncbi:MAG: type I glyceraldehyde-3-phosphate dehydrogenase [Candidatus Buchananbacteria bacterium RIFCSPHIGHO2_01_FULL_44_11]|uniref:Glyceraldehyde-3-phosphate dehydrogenase n=1 Tax=Candidatus Buchananbacteria bacterium RIFCSPHIGHO2_01_FULL_44_11 TaxID=1797535 RepID=A0A1G1Y2J7_9BACT|nr:MAG: type I glyceraldehyde-3-phosphate dehydrogenase [Candidatus Buchananbacteria bacterium RIFCSPHIGHO2_01_FULL_44_11]
MTVKIAINGFGRIGRAAFKIALANKNLEVVGINDLADNKILAHLLKYDTVYGEYEASVQATKEGIKVNGKTYPVLAEKEPAKLPWKKLNVDVVLECTGRFTNKKDAGEHLKAGAKRVVISAPGKDKETQTLVFGTKLTSDVLKSAKAQSVISNASCTTNCISPVIQVLESAFGVEKALMTTIHSYTADQNLVDGDHRDLRRARAAAYNIIPTSTGAAISTTEVVPSLKNLFDGVSLRVPTICGSISDITAVLKRKKVTVKQINEAFKEAVKNPIFKNILTVSNKPLVSSDIIGTSYSAIIDLELTQVVGGNLVKVFAWYDNEWAYSLRLGEMAEALAKNLK